MTYWWEFGEHTGYEGNDLGLFRVACAFCNAKGNVKLYIIKKRNIIQPGRF
jgi:hypothetical protein